MQARRQRKQTPTVQQPAWEEWLSREKADGNAGAPDPDGSKMREAIAALAYSFWEARGRQGGSAEEDWLRAEEKMKRHMGRDTLN